MEDLTIVLQAGGQSVRMGRDKGLVPFRGKTLIEYILDQLAGISAPVIVVTNQPADYAFLNLPLYRDLIPGWGALGGLHAALAHSGSEYALVLACDMPFISRDFLDYVYSLAPDFDAVVPVIGEKQLAEPFRAVYRKTCLDPIARAIGAGKRRVISFFDEVGVRFVRAGEIQQFDPELVTFFNVNTPQDLVAAGRIADRLAGSTGGPGR
jgi:molybdopterin-guanine dinucleotide biosynthesis protein A